MKISIIGAGTWGVVVASYLSKKNHEITIYHRNSKTSKQLITNHEHPNLTGKSLHGNIKYSSDLSLINSPDLNILAVPTHTLYDYTKEINVKDSNFLILSKGYDMGTGLLPSQLLNQRLDINMNKIAVLSGPNHAEEIIDNKSAATVISSTNNNFAKKLQTLFSSETLRVYTTDDIIGVQIGGAVKNVIAIASGICAGLNLGDNTQAALVSRGINEILELSKIYDMKNNTLYGLSGIGDLVATCYSQHSRNRQLGLLLSQGKSLNEAKDSIGMVSEGINTTKILNDIISDNKLQMPICSEVYNILYNNADPKSSLIKLMSRSLKVEG